MVGDSADPIDRLRGGLRRQRLRPPRGAGGDGQGRDAAVSQRQRRIPRAPGPRRLPSARLRPLRRRHQHPQRQLDLRQPRTTSGARRRRRSSTRSTTSRSPSSPPARSAIAPPTEPSCSRSATWRRLYNPASGLIEPRYASGAFPADYDNLDGGGFVEGNSVPVHLDGPPRPRRPLPRDGRPRDRRRRGSTASCAELNGGAGGTHTDHALLGNEPTLHAPWLYDWTQRPYGTQEAVRRGLRLYDTAPDGYPGNDDLGTLSSWYVFGALGLYPEVPGVGLLAIGSPLFGRASIAMPNHRRLTITATAYTFRKRKPSKGGKGQRKKPKRSKSRSARPPPPTYARRASTATPTGGPGPPTARSPAAGGSPSSSAPARTPSGEAQPPPFRPRSARTAGCRSTPARLDWPCRFILALAAVEGHLSISVESSLPLEPPVATVPAADIGTDEKPSRPPARTCSGRSPA